MADTDLARLWATNPQAATSEARRRIAVAAEMRADTLDLSDLAALEVLPAEIGQLTDLRHLYAGDQSVEGKTTRYNNRIREIAAVRGLPLETLNLRNTRVSEITAIGSLTALTRLSLNDTKVSDVTALRPLTTLATLALDDTEVSDISALGSLTALTTLSLDRTQVSDITALGALTALTKLWLDVTQVTDISALGSMTSLTALWLNYTQTSDITPLSGCRSLDNLWLRSTNLADITPLLDIPRFGAGAGRALTFGDTPAADWGRDRRLHMLSLLDPEQCAIQTVQYLQGTHPDFRDPPGGAAPPPLAQRVAAASPLGVAQEDGTLHVANFGVPERLAPHELAEQLEALRLHAKLFQNFAENRQLPAHLMACVDAYLTAL